MARRLVDNSGLYKEIITEGAPCCGCGHPPVLIHYYYDMWYVECSNPECCKFQKNMFLGQTREIALNNWAACNRPINRSYQKERKKK